MSQRRSILFALLLIGAGVLLLLREADVISEDVRAWPILLIAIGVVWVIERYLWGRGGPGFVGPLVVLAAGLAFLFEDLDVFEDDGVLIPFVVIAVGLALVLAAVPASRPAQKRRQVPLEGASHARVEINHGAGRLRIGSHIGGGNVLEGTFGGGVDVRQLRDGEGVQARLSANLWRTGIPWQRSGELDWSLTLARHVPIELRLRTGASSSELDLSDLSIDDLQIETGASKILMTIPATGRPRIRIRAGAAHIKVAVPSRMAARIEVNGALAEVTVDLHRFPKVGDREYRSPDLDEAAHRADIQIDAGAANVDVS